VRHLVEVPKISSRRAGEGCGGTTALARLGRRFAVGSTIGRGMECSLGITSIVRVPVTMPCLMLHLGQKVFRNG